MPGRTYHKENTLLGAGECYIALMDADGNYEGERYLGDSPGASMTVETEEVETDSSDGSVSRSLLRAVVSRKFSFSLQLGDTSPENLQLFTGGDLESPSQSTAAVTNESYTVQADRWIHLGQSSSHPGGVDTVASFQSITTGDTEADADGSSTDIKAATERLVLEEVPNSDPKEYTGRIYIPRASNLAGKWISVNYTPKALPAGAKRVKVDEVKALNGSFRYRETLNPQGTAKPRHYYARLCSLKGEGQVDLKSREATQRLGLTVDVMEPAGDYPLLSIDGEAQS